MEFKIGFSVKASFLVNASLRMGLLNKEWRDMKKCATRISGSTVAVIASANSRSIPAVLKE